MIVPGLLVFTGPMHPREPGPTKGTVLLVVIVGTSGRPEWLGLYALMAAPLEEPPLLLKVSRTARL
jgi:hypothetical protein